MLCCSLFITIIYSFFVLKTQTVRTSKYQSRMCCSCLLFGKYSQPQTMLIPCCTNLKKRNSCSLFLSSFFSYFLISCGMLLFCFFVNIQLGCLWLHILLWCLFYSCNLRIANLKPLCNFCLVFVSFWRFSVHVFLSMFLYFFSNVLEFDLKIHCLLKKKSKNPSCSNGMVRENRKINVFARGFFNQISMEHRSIQRPQTKKRFL